MYAQQRRNYIYSVFIDGEFSDLTTQIEHWLDIEHHEYLATLRNQEIDRHHTKDYLITCPYCRTPLRLLYQKEDQYPYFSHRFDRKVHQCTFDDPKYNELNQQIIRARKYEGRTTGYLHDLAIQQLVDLIEKDPDAELLIKPESRRVYHVNGSGQYRYPDVYFRYGVRKIAIEVQNSPEWVNYISERQQFYNENDIHLIWVFTDNILKQNSVTISDIACRQAFNLFYLDNNAFTQGIKTKKVLLNCRYDTSVCFSDNEGHYPERLTQYEIVNLNQLTYPASQSPYYISFEATRDRIVSYCQRRNDIEAEYAKYCQHYSDYTYYAYAIECLSLAEFGTSPIKALERQNQKACLQRIGDCFIATFFLKSALKMYCQGEHFLREFDENGHFAKKVRIATQFWQALKAENHEVAQALFDRNRRTSQLTVNSWERSIFSSSNHLDLLFPDAIGLNQRALKLIEAIKSIIQLD